MASPHSASLKAALSEFPLQFCAARFLRQWEKHEQPLYERINAPNNTLDDLERALTFFQVSRCFTGIGLRHTEGYRHGNLAAIQRALSKATDKHRLDPDPITTVGDLASRLEKVGGKYTISAATKLLWLTFRSPFVIFDKRARSALSSLHPEASTKDYGIFYASWRSLYGRLEEQICASIEDLPNGRNFMPRSRLSNPEIKALAQKAWFKERVLDRFLWEVGGD